MWVSLSDMKQLFQHAAITDGVTVRVAVNFLPEQSRVDAGKWFWVYHIRIENESDQPIQLISRHWRITDGRGQINFVDGDGVVGEQPVLDDDRILAELGVSSVLLAPIMAGNRAIGQYLLGRRADQPAFTPNDCLWMAAIAGHVGLSFEQLDS